MKDVFFTAFPFIMVVLAFAVLQFLSTRKVLRANRKAALALRNASDPRLDGSSSSIPPEPLRTPSEFRSA